MAMARRLAIDLTLEDFARASDQVPVLCNLQPSGKYLMEDLYYAGGLMALLTRLTEHLDLSCMTANGRTLGENIAGAAVYNDDVIRTADNPVYPAGGLVVLRGNLAPRGAVLKRAAADPRLLQHSGPAVVFRNFGEMLERIDDPDLPVTADSVLVLQDSGPVGAPGMPEWGMLPIPKKLLAAGVRDMVRLSDARMSGTSYGTCVLHVCPESRVGGPLGLVRDGDLITLDTQGRKLEILVDARRARRDAEGRGSRRRRTTSAVSVRCTSRTFFRLTRAATSISWRDPGARRSPRRAFPERAGTFVNSGYSSRSGRYAVSFMPILQQPILDLEEFDDDRLVSMNPTSRDHRQKRQQRWHRTHCPSLSHAPAELLDTTGA